MADTETVDALVPDAPAPAPDPEPEPSAPNPREEPDPKQESRVAFEARKANERAASAEKQLAHYKAREEEDRRAKLTEEQRRQEEFEVLRDKAQRLEKENALVKIATRFKIREEHWQRIVGNTAEELEEDAERLSKIAGMTTAPVRGGSPTDPPRDATGAKSRIYTRAELQADPVLARSPEVLQANREGRVK